jgi:hypothetical protein
MDIKNYLTPLSNNERAVLLWAAGIKWRPERNQSIQEDLSRYQTGRATQLPEAQVDKAVQKLIDKGYIRLEPKRGNYFAGRRYWVRTGDGHGMHYGGQQTPYQKAFTEKSMGGWTRTRWLDIAKTVTVLDVNTMVLAYREAQRVEHLQEQAERVKQVAELEKANVESLANACREFLAACDSNEVVIREDGNYKIGPDLWALRRAAERMDRWKYQRASIENEALAAQKLLKGTAA